MLAALRVEHAEANPPVRLVAWIATIVAASGKTEEAQAIEPGT